jgi:hypothetical protein
MIRAPACRVGELRGWGNWGLTMLGKLALGVLALLALVGEAEAGSFEDGNGLYALCTSNNLGEQVHCMGYIEGVVDTMKDIDRAFNKPQCVPDGTHAKQTVDVVVNYLRDHPVERSYSASSDVYAAVAQAWNCQ